MSGIFLPVLRNVFKSSSLSTLKTTSGFNIQKCNYLSPAYQCIEAWNRRHHEEIIQRAGKPNEFYFCLMQDYKNNQRIAAIDADVYLHSLSSDGSNWSPEDVEELLQKIRRSAESKYLLDSSQHITFRLLLNNDCTDSMFKMITQPPQYGIFMDHYVSNLVMDHFLVKKDYSCSARAASRLMLVEDFGPSLNQMFVLLSCLQYAINADTCNPWANYEPVIEEPEDDVKIRQDYYPNPYFDDHFHLREPSLLTGKTLAMCSRRCLPLGDFRVNCQLIGWAMYRKWDKLQDVLAITKTGVEAGVVAPTAVLLLQQHISTHCEDADLQSVLLKAVDALPVQQDFDLVAAVEEALVKQVQLCEPEAIQTQVKVYEEWAAVRVKRLAEHIAEQEKKQLLDDIERKKEDLKSKEQLLYYFDNEKKLSLFLSKVGKFEHPFPRKRPSRYTRIRPTKVDENYVPPVIRGKTTHHHDIVDPNFSYKGASQ